jgi:hypothetical protein
MEKSMAFAGELGGKAAYVHLADGAWPGNCPALVKPGAAPDFKLFDRYMDLVQKHLSPQVVVLVVRNERSKFGPEAAAGWKPLMDGVMERMKARGLAEKCVLGMVFEGGRYDADLTKDAVEFFKGLNPEIKWADLAHYGGAKGNINGVPYGYAMSVWGNTTPFKSKAGFGCRDLPLVLAQHFRCQAVIDLRPFGRRAALYMAPEEGMNVTRGLGPIGLDFWNVRGEKLGPRQGDGGCEPYVGNVGMGQTTCALLAPGPEGPVPTARLEVFREGLQQCEARLGIELALSTPELKARLSPDLVKRCEALRQEEGQARAFVNAGEYHAQGEGWTWYESLREELAGKCFACAGEVAKALGGK